MMLSLRNQAVLYRQLSVLASAGLTPSQSVTALIAENHNNGVSLALEGLLKASWDGTRLSESLGSAGIVPQYHSALLAVGEQTGKLDIVYKWLSSSAEHDWALQQRLKMELWNTKLTTSFAIFVGLGLLLFGKIGASAIFTLIPLAAFACVLLAEHLATRLTGNSRPILDRLILKLPILGQIAYDMAQARFARSFAVLFAAGAEIAPALRLAAKSCGSVTLSERVLEALPAIARGERIAQSLASTGAFPPFLIDMLNTGEITGNIDTAMECAAKFHEEATAHKMHQFCIVLGVAAVLIVGALVGEIAGKSYGAW